MSEAAVAAAAADGGGGARRRRHAAPHATPSAMNFPCVRVEPVFVQLASKGSQTFAAEHNARDQGRRHRLGHCGHSTV